MSDTKDEQKLTTSADALRAPNDPTEDPYHTRGVSPEAAEAGFRAAGYPEKGPLAGRDPGDKLSIEDAGNLGPIAIADSDSQVNPTADKVGPEGGIIASDALVDDHSKTAHPDPKDTRKPSKPAARSTSAPVAARTVGTPIVVANPAPGPAKTAHADPAAPKAKK
jgi:hypothetical protein